MQNGVARPSVLGALTAKHSEAQPASGVHFAVSLRLTPSCLRNAVGGSGFRVFRNLVTARGNTLSIYDVALHADSDVRSDLITE